MSGYKRIMQFNCPNGWDDCGICENYEKCKAVMFEPEEETSTIKEAVKIAEKVIQHEAVESVARIKGNMAQEFIELSSDERMDRFYSRKVQGLHHKDVIPLDGPSAPGGGGKSNVKNSNKGNKPTIYIWEPT